MEEKKLVPKLRFPGFTEPWEQRKLGEIASINPRTELPNSFKYVELESVIGTNLIGCKKIEKENAPSRAQRLASFGDIFYQTVRPYQRNNYLFEKDDDDVVFSTGYAQLRSELDSYFLFTLVQTDSFVSKVLDHCTGTSYPAINSSELGKILISVPQNKLESHQIGTVFRVLDNLITLHQRKLEHLKLKKKSLLQKLFPKEGEVYPEIRFPGFTDPWEQRELGELANNVTEKNVTLSETETFTNSAELGIISQNSFFDRNITNKDNIDNYYIIQPEDFVYNPRISVTAPVGPINRNKLGRTGIISPLYTVFRPHDINTRYLEYFFKTSKWHSYMRFNGDSGARSDRFSIKLKLFYTMPIPVPSFEEQAEIGRLLERFTESITLHQEESFLHKYML